MPQPKLFEPITVGGKTLANRIVIAPMCQYSADGDGNATDWHLIHLGSLALSGAGMLIIEATAVSPEGRITHDCLGLWSDSNAAALGKVLDSVRQHSSMPLAIQLAHAGRKASARRPWDGEGQWPIGDRGWATVAPTAEAFGPGLERVPQALDEAGIARLQADFVAAARRSQAAGFQWLELHFAHGYLAHQFLSPLVNRRTDRYGGSFENRIRFPLETAQAVRAIWPQEFPLTVRLSCTDWVEGGWDIAQAVEFSRRLKAIGIDLIDCSSGGAIPGVKIPLVPGYQVPLATQIRREAGIATAAVGLITEPGHADAIVREGQADLVLIARESLRDPHWPRKAALALGQKDALSGPVQYGARGER